MQIKGITIPLNIYPSSKVETNRHFAKFDMPEFEQIHLPNSMVPFSEPWSKSLPIKRKGFVIDDNRSAIDPEPALTIDGTKFYLSVKGIGSTTSPFSRRALTKSEICSLVQDSALKERIMHADYDHPRYITGELWSRGSPYGGQGYQYANIAMKASEFDDVTSIHGFRIAPLVKIVFFPEEMENKIKSLYWYRSFKLQTVQETRLVPSNVRIYFHSDYTIGDDTIKVFDLFGIENNDQAIEFEKNFVKSGMAILTLLARSIKDNGNGTYSGLDFYDVWLDKDAVIAPDGTIYWVDMEGLESITLWEKDIEEKMEYQIYRSLYEMMYAYEQIERERCRRFGYVVDRKLHFEYLLRESLKDDPIINLERKGSSLNMNINNILKERKLVKEFTLVDWI